MKLLFVFSLFLVFVGAVIHKAPLDKFDYYYLVLQWPESFCNTGQYQCHPNIPNYFTIHGLWPEKNDTQKNDTQVKCDGQPQFNFTQINGTTLMSELEHSWPNLVDNWTDESFWKHEWKKHGTCTTDIFRSEFAQREYFNRTIALANKLNLIGALSRSGIKPGNTYKIKEIKNAIVNETKLMPRLKCKKDKNKKLQLLEVILCVKKNAKEWENCTYDDFSCRKNKSNILFPNTTVSTSPRDYKIALPNPTVTSTSTDDEL